MHSLMDVVVQNLDVIKIFAAQNHKQLVFTYPNRFKYETRDQIVHISSKFATDHQLSSRDGGRKS